jgi:hypothetical protein
MLTERLNSELTPSSCVPLQLPQPWSLQRGQEHPVVLRSSTGGWLDQRHYRHWRSAIRSG